MAEQSGGFVTGGGASRIVGEPNDRHECYIPLSPDPEHIRRCLAILDEARRRLLGETDGAADG